MTNVQSYQDICYGQVYKNICNIFKEHELDPNSVCKESLLTAADGKTYRTKYYNLDVIISVGYRVKSIAGTRFRQWATIDDTVYHIGASLKDLGKKWFGFNRMEWTTDELLSKI